MYACERKTSTSISFAYLLAYEMKRDKKAFVKETPLDVEIYKLCNALKIDITAHLLFTCNLYIVD